MSLDPVHTGHNVQSNSYCTREDIDPFSVWKKKNSKGAIGNSVDIVDTLDSDVIPQPSPTTSDDSDNVAWVPVTEVHQHEVVEVVEDEAAELANIKRLLQDPASIQPSDLPEVWKPEWLERSAVREYCGGMNRETADRAALIETVNAMKAWVSFRERANDRSNSNPAAAVTSPLDPTILSPAEWERWNGMAAVMEIGGRTRQAAEQQAFDVVMASRARG